MYSQKNARPRVAVLLAVYNGVDWLPAQVDSILQQRDVDITLYISDDGSSDGSLTWCQKLMDQDSRVILLGADQRFGSATQNFFRLVRDVDFSGFDYVAFADQDDIWYQGKLAKGADLLAQNGYDGYSSNVEAFWPDGRTSLIDKAQPQQDWDYLFEAGGPGCTYLMTHALAEDLKQTLQAKPELASKIGYHDWLCYAFARGRGYRWYIDAETTMQYRQHDNNAVGVNQGLSSLITRMRYVMQGDAMKQVEYVMSVVFDDIRSAPLRPPRSRFDFIGLAFSTTRCRRRWRDRLYFFCFCLLMGLFGRKS